MQSRWHLARLARIVVLIAFVGLVVALAVAPVFAMDQAKVTTDQQTGGVPTRFTYEGFAQSGPPITEISFEFPADFDLSKARVEPLTLQGLKRVPVGSELAINGQVLTVKFEPPIESSYEASDGNQTATLLRVPIYEVLTPNQGGDYPLKVTYIQGGQTKTVSGLTFSYNTPTGAEQVARFLENQAWVEQFNSVKLFSLFFKPQLIALSIPLLFWGWLYSIALVLIAFPLAIFAGLMLAFAKMSKIVPLRWIAGAYVNVIRGTPLFLQIAVVFIGLRVAGIRAPDFLSSIFVLALNSSAYLTEIFRAGIQSIHKGQFEAASSLGMNYWQSMRYVIVPQTVKRVLPTMTSEFILLFKDTALFSAFGIIELMYRANSIVSRTGNLTPFVVAAVYYLIVTIPLINAVGRLEASLAVAEGGQGGAPAARPKRGALDGFTRTEGPDVEESKTPDQPDGR